MEGLPGREGALIVEQEHGPWPVHPALQGTPALCWGAGAPQAPASLDGSRGLSWSPLGLEDKDIAEPGFTPLQLQVPDGPAPPPALASSSPAPTLTGQVDPAAGLGARRPWGRGPEPEWRQPQGPGSSAQLGLSKAAFIYS